LTDHCFTQTGERRDGDTAGRTPLPVIYHPLACAAGPTRLCKVLAQDEHMHAAIRQGTECAGDNVLFGTDYCLGFSTVVTRSIEFIHQLRSSAGSHERVAVIELFGRQRGETTLMASYLAGADRALIPEVPYESGRVAESVDRDRRSNPSNYAVTISESCICWEPFRYGRHPGFTRQALVVPSEMR
jgi:hypothetical protein